MRHRGTKASAPRNISGYDWYDAKTGAIDRCRLAAQASRLVPPPNYDEPPAWLAEAVSVVEGCGEPEAELLLQQGITSLEDLAACEVDVLTQLPGIDEEGAERIKANAVVLAERKREEDEAAAAAEAANEGAAPQ